MTAALITAADRVWRVAVVQVLPESLAPATFQFCCESCDRVSDPRPLDVTVALLAGHLLGHIERQG